jgi:hypothetical protein
MGCTSIVVSSINPFSHTACGPRYGTQHFFNIPKSASPALPFQNQSVPCLSYDYCANFFAPQHFSHRNFRVFRAFRGHLRRRKGGVAVGPPCSPCPPWLSPHPRTPLQRCRPHPPRNPHPLRNPPPDRTPQLPVTRARLLVHHLSRRPASARTTWQGAYAYKSKNFHHNPQPHKPLPQITPELCAHKVGATSLYGRKDQCAMTKNQQTLRASSFLRTCVLNSGREALSNSRKTPRHNGKNSTFAKTQRQKLNVFFKIFEIYEQNPTSPLASPPLLPLSHPPATPSAALALNLITAHMHSYNSPRNSTGDPNV